MGFVLFCMCFPTVSSIFCAYFYCRKNKLSILSLEYMRDKPHTRHLLALWTFFLLLIIKNFLFFFSKENTFFEILDKVIRQKFGYKYY